MAALTHLDTHCVVWLYRDERQRLSQPAIAQLEVAPTIEISPAVMLELEYLREIGRLAVAPDEILGSLVTELGLAISNVSFADAVDQACLCSWTRDPFDRLIVGSAVAAGASLVTADHKIRTEFAAAIW